MSCITDYIDDDIINDCDNLSITGVESDIVVIPHKEFDKTASVLNADNRMLLDDLVLNAGTSGFKIEGIRQKNIYKAEFVPSEETLDRYKHMVGFAIMTPSPENRLQASKLAKGESYLVVIRRRYKGAEGKAEFIVLGYDAGLYVTVNTEASNENDGAFILEMASKDKSLEYDMARNLFEGDTQSTSEAFNNKFAQAAA